MTERRTPAQQAVIMQLSQLLGKDSPYRVGALLLTYDREDKDGCQIAQAIAMRDDREDLEATAVHLVGLLQALENMAAQLRSKLDEQKPGEGH